MEKLRERALWASGFLGFVVPTYFAWTVYQDNIPQNIATWSMMLLLDGIGVILAYKDGNKKPYMQIGWVLAAICIVLAVTLSNSPWHWGWIESISLILCGVAVMLWLILNPRIALWAYMMAMYISVVPLAVDYWSVPQLETLWVWLWSIVTCLLAVYGAPKRDFSYTFVPWAAAILNGIVATLCVL